MAKEEVITELMSRRSNSKIIISNYINNGGGGGTLCKEKLGNIAILLQSTGADVIQLVVDVAYITDVAPLFHLLAHSQVFCVLFHLEIISIFFTPIISIIQATCSDDPPSYIIMYKPQTTTFASFLKGFIPETNA